MSRLRSILRKIVRNVPFLRSKKRKNPRETNLPKFANTPTHVVIETPRRIINAHRMYIGDNVYIGPGSLLMAVERYHGITPAPEGITPPDQKFDPILIIGNRVTATGALQISALERIEIEDDVMFASNVFICDGLHGYTTASVPYKYQRMQNIKPIRIGMGSWIGQNVVIMPGVEIGSQCIIGANSVVTKSIPDQCIAMGAPARISKRWNSIKKVWDSVPEKVDNE